MIFKKCSPQLLGQYIYQTNLVEIIHGEGGGVKSVQMESIIPLPLKYLINQVAGIVTDAR